MKKSKDTEINLKKLKITVHTVTIRLFIAYTLHDRVLYLNTIFYVISSGEIKN
jgi:uncharacterized membrane protein